MELKSRESRAARVCMTECPRRELNRDQRSAGSRILQNRISTCSFSRARERTSWKDEREQCPAHTGSVPFPTSQTREPQKSQGTG